MDDDNSNDENDNELHAELTEFVGRRAVDRVFRDYLTRLWRKRAALIGGAPMLDVKIKGRSASLRTWQNVRWQGSRCTD